MHIKSTAVCVTLFEGIQPNKQLLTSESMFLYFPFLKAFASVSIYDTETKFYDFGLVANWIELSALLSPYLTCWFWNAFKYQKVLLKPLNMFL